MTISRIGNMALHLNTLKDVANGQSKLAELQIQMSSGYKSSTFAGLNGQVEQFTLLEAKMRSSQQYIDSNKLAVSRMKTADQAMGNLVDLADDMENLIVLARSAASGNALDVPQQMRNLMESFTAALNINFEGRYLFGGTNTGNPPVPNALATPEQPGVADASYYAGAKQDVIYRADEKIEYAFPVRADHIAFQKIYAAANLAIQGADANSDAILGQALSMMQSGQVDLNSARAALNAATINIEQISERQVSLKLYWQGVTEAVSKTDMVAASTEVANHEAILQATFQVFSRISQLRLSDFLR